MTCEFFTAGGILEIKIALRVTRQYDKMPESTGGQADFLRIIYGERIRNRPVGEMSEAQIYSIASSAWNEACRMYERYERLAGGPTGLEAFSTETIEAWLGEAERESSVSDDQRTHPPEEVERMSAELCRRIALNGMTR